MSNRRRQYKSRGRRSKFDKTINVRRFQPSVQLRDPCSVFVVGKTGSGKSTVSEHLMFIKRHYRIGIAFTGSAASRRQAIRYVPNPEHVYDGWQPEKLKQLLDVQDKRVELYGEKYVRTYFPAYVYFDDLMWSMDKMMKSPIFQRLMTDGRHDGLFVLICSQYCMKLSKPMRKQISFTICTLEKNKKYVEPIYEFFNIGFPDFRSFHKTFRQCTRNYEVFVLDNSIRPGCGYVSDSDEEEETVREIESNVCWWKASINLPPFKMSGSGLGPPIGRSGAIKPLGVGRIGTPTHVTHPSIGKGLIGEWKVRKVGAPAKTISRVPVTPVYRTRQRAHVSQQHSNYRRLDSDPLSVVAQRLPRRQYTRPVPNAHVARTARIARPVYQVVPRQHKRRLPLRVSAPPSSRNHRLPRDARRSVPRAVPRPVPKRRIRNGARAQTPLRVARAGAGRQ